MKFKTLFNTHKYSYAGSPIHTYIMYNIHKEETNKNPGVKGSKILLNFYM